MRIGEDGPAPAKPLPNKPHKSGTKWMERPHEQGRKDCIGGPPIQGNKVAMAPALENFLTL